VSLIIIPNNINEKRKKGRTAVVTLRTTSENDVTNLSQLLF